MGLSRAKALQIRVSQLRVCVAEHWKLCDVLGAHFSKYHDAIEAARIVGLPADDRSWHADALAAGNWARHAPPPDTASIAALPPGLHAPEFERFRESLFGHSGGTCERGGAEVESALGL